MDDHCLNVGCVAEALRELLPASVQAFLPPEALVLAAGHDIGKITVGFQLKCPAWIAAHGLARRAANAGWQFSESNHAAVSQHFFHHALSAGTTRRWAIAVGGHHGRFLGKGPCPSGTGRWHEAEAAWMQSGRQTLFGKLVGRFGPPPDFPPASDEQLLFVAGWMTVADWIGSNERFFPLQRDYSPERSRARARQALEELRWGRGALCPDRSFADLFGDAGVGRAAFEANPLQALCLEAIRAPGLYVIEAPMGGGKTEAALAVAHRLIAAGHHSGFYFALPTQLTSNRIHTRVERFLRNALTEETDHPLAHANSWLQSRLRVHLRPAHPRSDGEETPDDHVAQARSWFASSRQALLARYGVGTVDQALLGAVAARYCAVRLFGLAGKVVILDEVHSYDAYTSAVLDRLIERLLALRCTVLVLSATLTTRRREELLELGGAAGAPAPTQYPLLSYVGPGGEVTTLGCVTPAGAPRHITVCGRNHGDPGLLAEVCERAESGACVLLIRNTVAEAQATFRTLQSLRREGGPEVGLLHSRFPQFRREEQESLWMARLGKEGIGAQRPPGCVLVATQVVEQSVDIDADLLVTDPAPTDLLLQRIGRLWRHPRANRPAPRPEVWILCPDLSSALTANALRSALGKSARVYPPYTLLRSLEVWRELRELRLPEDIRPLLDASHAGRQDEAEPPAWVELRKDLEREIERQRNVAGLRSNLLDFAALTDEEGVQTRWNGLPSANLVLLTEPPAPLAGNETGLRFLNGETATASAHEWRFPVAAAIHRNAVKLPLYAIRAALDTAAQPGWLRLHFRGPAVLGVGNPDDGNIAVPGDALPVTLSYHNDLGVWMERTAPTPSIQREEDDESWF
ncbi:MAG: CRISPR-associated helicase Cas3' [Verrucomicrobiales bacterium]|nr:CRISPR-associated helicase Cas3' [Verrucomicrobiales bacterium]MCP5528480.1 CRISPR-associated helicase Cas3' [Verrucomicrobiales bacterium]